MSKYWESRAAQRELESQLIASKYLARMEEQLRMAQANIIQQIEAFYARYALDHKVSYAEAKQYLTAKELKDSRHITLQQYKALSLAGNPEYDRILNAIGYRARISRLEMLHLQIQMQMLELYGSTNGLQAYTYTGLTEVYENAYYKTLFDIATFTAVYQPVTKLTDDVMKEVLTYNWSGKEFSKRIWGHKEKTMAAIKKELERSFKQGRSLIKTSRAISEATNVALSRAQALVRTEANFFHGLAANNAYRETDLERYQILATLDNRTSEICKAQDLKIYLTKDYKPGTNAPPFHTRCRTTTIPYFDESEYMEGEKRIARDPITSTNAKVSAKISYQKWYQDYVIYKHGQDTIDLFNKKQQNLAQDKIQYREFQNILGKHAPSLDDFQTIKYNGEEEWYLLKGYRHAVEKKDIHIFVDFKTYKNTANEVKERIVGITTADGVKISGYKSHFVDRIIGQIEAGTTGKGKRSGVKIEDALKALINPMQIKEKKNSRQYINDKCIVTINQTTGNLIQTTPKTKEVST